ncbi:phospho-N-acetylmuramoyl-pentapeptide-transferase [Altericista sp. CCNU0014]|uniref:phospho-N-acetylmuramoyl-pentapeptide- transferase n=1 Tax=Altericista sp. CCNU0014 TaxID=3082949 RepID=UPI0038504994
MESPSPAQIDFWSGKRLYVLLLAGLLVSAMLSDIAANRWSQPLSCFTLPFVASAGLASALGYWAVPWLRRLKAGQVIREDGPQSHLKKAGTPTMGGIFFVPASLVLGVAWAWMAGIQGLEVTAAALLTAALGFVGWLDDWQVLRKKSNKGLSARVRLAIEFGAGGLFALWLLLTRPDISTLVLPFGLAVPIGILFLFLAVFVVAAESNAVNLTDGMDGLAAGTTAIAFFGLGQIVAPDWPGLTLFCACMSGSCMGFLAHNHHPAKVFMGDTGSLALGGALAAVGLISNSLWVLLMVSGLFLAESLSVIAQVGYYKATKGPDGIGKRLFKMAPIHHHFEQSGWPESRVVATFYGIAIALALLALNLSQFA